MDSSFVNYDGRSVHDMIESLLAMSGDPEAIRRLQESINAVDQRAQSSIAVVNAAIAQLDEDKQDVGDYVLNGGATGYATFKFSKSAHVQNMRRGNNQYSNGLSILGENSEADLDGVLREWFRYERHTGQLQGYIYKEGTSSWEAVHSWQADEDTGWQTLTNAYVDIYYRKKNGIVFINMAQAAKQAITTEQITSVVQLPEGCRPDTTIYLYHEVAVGGSLRLQIGNTGYIAIRATSSTIAQGSQIQGMNSFPV